jgi:2-oxoglutarate ferredoxin oxidoreductase subunit beta
MFSIPIPNPSVHGEARNAIGLTIAEYGGAPSTLCGGCGHDSITAAIKQACFELAIQPHRLVKLSGIGCSSKTPAYFVSGAHGFNAVHGRMPPVATGAYAAHGGLTYLGVSGDGDTGSIGLGAFMHAMRRQIRMLYIIENNGVYGLTKGQFSAMADLTSKTKQGIANQYMPMDPVRLAIQTGAGFVGRGFSGDKEKLVPLIKAGLTYPGFALLDVLSPCVSFNNHDHSTKSYHHIRRHEHPVSPTSKREALAILDDCEERGDIAMGLLYQDPAGSHLHVREGTSTLPLRELPLAALRPPSGWLDQFQATCR